MVLMVPLLIMATSLVSEINTRVALVKGWVNSFLAFMGQLYFGFYNTDEIETNHLFVKIRGPHSGQPLEYADVNDLFQRLKSKTGIDAHAHLLRHSSLTSLAKNGMRPEVLRERAGHAQFQYTYQLYVHPSEEEMRQEWKKAESQLQLSQPTRKEKGK